MRAEGRGQRDEGRGQRARGTDEVAARLARIRVPLGFVCGIAVLWFARPTSGSLMVGGGVAAVGELLRIWASGHLEKGREVTRSGPYRLTRHPLYMGSAIIALGAAIAAAHAGVALLIGAYMVLTIVSAVRHEEAGMRAAFGDQYDAYLQSRAAPVERPFSIARALKNKEHHAIAGLVAVAAILAVKAAWK
ncbi:MAG TPA: methyltransferase [Vicinamibacterales bacterium]|nr:methyltransferase [Vicinamibacterales bacterium]